MREIIFRAKRLKDGQWVQGYLVKRPSAIQMPGYGGPWYIETPPADPDDAYGSHNVNPGTVGQWTGARDYYSNMIFDGDLLIYGADPDRTPWLVMWGDAGWYVQPQKKPQPAADPMILWRPGMWKKIGNRWDNPELLIWGCGK